MTTHICPHCSKPCQYKDGIMCTITGCIKDDVNNIIGSGHKGVEKLKKAFFGSISGK